MKASLALLVLLPAMAVSVKVCTDDVTITAAINNVKAYPIITFKDDSGWLGPHTRGSCNGEKSGLAEESVDDKGFKTMRFCCDSDDVVKNGQKFDYASVEIMHAQWGFHRSVDGTVVRFSNHKKGASHAVTAGRDELPLNDFWTACPRYGDKAYLPQKGGWYYFKEPYNTKGESENGLQRSLL